MRVSMKTLQNYVAEQNSWNAIFKMPAMQFPLDQAAVTDLAKSIDAKLSPENLHCDGEISPAQARKKYNHLHTVLKQLRSYASRNGMTMPEMWEA
tara:strand:+ start:1423 stop:1707 length:285 start_codon:yes stop_codon:yes gene_type:complete